MFTLASRPKQLLEGKQDEQFEVSARRNELIYLRKCVRCKVEVTLPSAKICLEDCEAIEFHVRGMILSGTLDIYKCKDLRIDLEIGVAVPVVTIETSKNVTLSVVNPREQIGSIYVQNSADVTATVSGSVFQIPAPPETDADSQLVATWTGLGFTSEEVIREGAHGYPTTVSKKAAADAKLETAGKQFEKMVKDSIKAPSRSASESSRKTESKAEEPRPREQQPPTINFTEKELEKGKDKLKHAETVEKHIPVVGVPARSPAKVPSGPDTAIKEDENKKEFFETSDKLTEKLDVLGEWVKASKHAIIFTGAGISTSTGIPDFRSGMNTVLETGPGVWELRAQGAARSTNAKTTSMLKAIPSPAHMAIVELHKKGFVKATVSQNVDGLHRRSGIPANELAELHGNTNLETCNKCGRQYLRDFETRTALGVFEHETTRLCDDPACQGRLIDSIVNFGENLPDEELNKSWSHAAKADLCIVLGSSLRVTPAALVPETVAKNGGKLVICNLQQTPLSDLASMTIHAKCDDVMAGLVKDRLGIDIPPFKVQRRMKLHLSSPQTSFQVFTVTGLDTSCDLPYSFIQKIELQMVEKSGKELVPQSSFVVEPFSVKINSTEDIECELKLKLFFHGHYGEAPLEIIRNVELGREWSLQYRMAYNPMIGTWLLNTS